MESHWLYRLYAADGSLLYVGSSADPRVRLSQHGALKTWWRDVHRVEVQRYDTRRDALDAERAAIRDEDPVHNLARYATVGGKTPLRSFRIPDALWDAVKQRADGEGVSLSEIVRQYLVEYVEAGDAE